MAFDVEGARKSGYTDTEIAEHLARENNFDISGARNGGYGDTDIIKHLTAVQPVASPIDNETGAPYIDRFIIGSASDPQEKFNRAKGLYGDDAQTDNEGRISFIDKETGRRAYVNPEGFDLGDVAGSAREMASLGVSAPFALTGPGIVAGTAAGVAASQGVDALAAGLGRARAVTRGNQAPQPMSAMDVAKDAGFETAGGLIGGGLGKGIGAMASHAATPVRNSVTQAWQNLGLPTAPSLAMAGQGKMAKIVESGLSGTPFGADAIDEAASVGRKAIAGRIDDMGRQIAGGNVLHTPQELGSFVMDSARRSRAAWDAQTEAMEAGIYSSIGDAPAGLNNVKQMLAEKMTGLSKPVAESKVAGLLKIIDPGVQSGADLNVNSVRVLKQRVGALLKDDKAATNLGIDAGDLEHLYGALNSDLKSAVRDPRKLVELEDFNKWYEAEKQSRNTLEQLLFPQGKSTLPEYTGKILMSPNVSPTTLQVLEKVVNPDSFNAVRGSLVSKVGRPRSSAGIPGDEISPETLLTHIGPDDTTHMDGAMAPEVRQQLFGGLMGDVRQAAGAMRDAGRAGNTSNTGKALGVMGTLATGGAALVNGAQGDFEDMGKWGAGALALPYLLSRAHTNPAFIRALASPQGPISRAITEKALPMFGLGTGLMSPSSNE